MIGQVIEVADKVLGKFIPDKNLKMKLQKEMTMAFHDANLAQIQLNKQEAAHKNIFVAGWRPFVGWTCGVALAYHFVVSPIIETILIATGVAIDLPSFEFSQLSSILMGMLGLGGLRTYEKMKGVSREK
jgi:hypothetical protein|tara:strand:+ start:6799 stop:7185 length:387 start_codon:yes stop_codon:yes gene_type:complete